MLELKHRLVSAGVGDARDLPSDWLRARHGGAVPAHVRQGAGHHPALQPGDGRQPVTAQPALQ